MTLRVVRPEIEPSDLQHTLAVVLEEPGKLAVREVALCPPADEDVVVELDWSGISTGTERLLFSGQMPAFPGLGYPLVPGYESVGRVVHAGCDSERRVGDHVFVPGSGGFQDVRGLFGGAAARIVVPGARTVPVDPELGDRAVLLALSATAAHALEAGLGSGLAAPDDDVLIVGHGALGRLMARLMLARGGPAPVVWETDPARRLGRFDYPVLAPRDDDRRDYATVFDVSGDAGLIDELIGRLVPNGQLVLAGFYHEPIRFDFAPAFMREVRIRVAAEWQPEDLRRTHREIVEGRLSLDDLITHGSSPFEAEKAYAAAFGDSTCIKMVLDWRNAQ